MELVISGLDVGGYIEQESFSESMEKVYDTENQFTTADGTEIRRCMGIQKSYNISLGCVPKNIKNMLRSRSHYGYISCTLNGSTGMYTMKDYNAQVIIQNASLDLWSVGFSLVSKVEDTESGGEEKRDYTVSCGGLTYSTAMGELVGEIKITNNSGGLPKSGICASQMEFSLDIEHCGRIIPGVRSESECKILNFDSPTYYVTGRSVSDGVYKVTCTDRTIYLDMPFDYSLCKSSQDENGMIAIDKIMAVIATQCGFYNWSYGDMYKIVPKLPFADLAASCRSILTSLSEIACGVWYCSADNSLRFLGYGEYHNTFSALSSISTDLQPGLTVGPIMGVLMINENTNDGETERISYGDVQDSFSAIKITSKYTSYTACDEVSKRVMGKSYTAFELQRSMCSSFYTVGTHVITPDDGGEYFATKIEICLSPTGIYASFSGDASAGFEWDFSGNLTQQVQNRISESTKYHGVSISKKEGFTCEGVGSKISMADGTITFHYIEDQQGE